MLIHAKYPCLASQYNCTLRFQDDVGLYSGDALKSIVMFLMHSLLCDAFTTDSSFTFSFPYLHSNTLSLKIISDVQWVPEKCKNDAWYSISVQQEYIGCLDWLGCLSWVLPKQSWRSVWKNVMMLIQLIIIISFMFFLHTLMFHSSLKWCL